MKLTRKDFLKTGLAAAGVVVGLPTAAGCGGSDDNSGSGGGGSGSCSAKIEGNHGHSMNVTAADLSAGAVKTYDIKGTATHTHDVVLSANDFSNLQNGQPANVSSTQAPDGHSHSITVTC